MEETPVVKPLSLQRRRYLSFFLMGIFVLGLPLLYLYATGYRLSLDENFKGVFVSTGGLYVAAERTGAEIYIDDQLVRETRTFRTAFYAQGLEPGTHRVHVQREGYHTWVKELPVYAHVVTEAEAFNLPLVADVRTISPWKNSRGATVLSASSTLAASTTNTVLVTKSIQSALLIPDTEYESLLALFEGDAVAENGSSLQSRVTGQFGSIFSSETATTAATSTKEFSGVQLFRDEEDVFARFIGSREAMPYYYCAEDFDLIENLPKEGASAHPKTNVALAAGITTEMIGPVQKVGDATECDPTIKLDRKGETIHSFDFYPGSTDLVVVALDSGVYVVEVDDRAWQNMQPIVRGKNLDMRVQSGQIYIFDGTLMYQVVMK